MKEWQRLMNYVDAYGKLIEAGGSHNDSWNMAKIEAKSNWYKGQNDLIMRRSNRKQRLGLKF